MGLTQRLIAPRQPRSLASSQLGVAQRQVEKILPLLREPLSLEAPADGEGETALEADSEI